MITKYFGCYCYLIVLFASASFIFYEVFVKKDVTIVVNGEEIEKVTTASTVGELLQEMNIDIKEHDELSIDLEAKLKDGMVISYDKANKVFVTVDDGEVAEYFTTADTVNEFLKEANISLSEDDIVAVSLDKNIFNGIHVAISKAFQVTINDGGQQASHMVTNQTIEELFTELGIKLSKYDRVNVDLDAEVKDNRKIEIVRVTKEFVSEQQVIPFQTETKNDHNLEKGKSKVIQEGKEGKKVVTYEITKENGEVVSKDVIEEEIIENSTNKVVAQGTKVQIQHVTSSSGFTTFSSYKYTAHCNSGCSGRTATGYDVSNTIYYDGMRIIAVDPNVIKLGSIVEIRTPTESFRAIALDTGGSIKGKTIDILVDSNAEANRWGKRSVQLRVIRSGW